MWGCDLSTSSALAHGPAVVVAYRLSDMTRVWRYLDEHLDERSIHRHNLFRIFQSHPVKCSYRTLPT